MGAEWRTGKQWRYSRKRVRVVWSRLIINVARSGWVFCIHRRRNEVSWRIWMRIVRKSRETRMKLNFQVWDSLPGKAFPDSPSLDEARPQGPCSTDSTVTIRTPRVYLLAFGNSFMNTNLSRVWTVELLSITLSLTSVTHPELKNMYCFNVWSSWLGNFILYQFQSTHYSWYYIKYNLFIELYFHKLLNIYNLFSLSFTLSSISAKVYIFFTNLDKVFSCHRYLICDIYNNFPCLCFNFDIFDELKYIFLFSFSWGQIYYFSHVFLETPFIPTEQKNNLYHTSSLYGLIFLIIPFFSWDLFFMCQKRIYLNWSSSEHEQQLKRTWETSLQICQGQDWYNLCYFSNGNWCPYCFWNNTSCPCRQY